jgi:tetratricopeptide (TPR) repeat protein
VLARGRTTEATLELSAGNFEAARTLLQSVLEVCERDGDVEGMLRAGANIADLERASGRVDEAVARGEALLPRLPRHRASTSEFNILGNLIGALLAQGNLTRAREVVAECARRHERIASDSNLWCVFDALGLLHALEGRWRAAAQLAGASDRAYRDHGQHARQPNEQADRDRLDALLAGTLSPDDIRTWRQEGNLMDVNDAMQLALGPRPDA